MFIECYDNNGVRSLRLVSGHTCTGAKGNKYVKKTVHKALGPLSKYDDGLPDYVGRLKQSFKDGRPLIDELQPFVDPAIVGKEYKFTYREGDPECLGSAKLIAHMLLERIMEELGLPAAIRSYKGFSKVEYDVLGYFRLLVYGRLLNPTSKYSTFNQNTDYIAPLVDSDDPYPIYDTLDFIQRYKKQIIGRLNAKLIKNAGRKNEIIFYDVTNFFFEIESPDMDALVDGEIVEGLRKKGVSKEERSLPIVQMGLFMDENGFPISIETFPGNTLDHLTVPRALSGSIDGMVNSRYVFIGDRGVCNYKIIGHLVARNKGYILSKSILKSTKEEKAWIVNESDYIKESEVFKYKSRVVHKRIETDDGKSLDIVEKAVVYWSAKFYNRQIAENRTFLEFLDKLMRSPASFRATSAQAKSLRGFLKKEVVNSQTGEILDSSKLKTMVDESKINEYRSLFGYYQIVTSELLMPDKAVIEKYHGLSQIENQFRIMKSDLETRPIFVRTRDHIEAHLLICMIALVLLRVIQKRIVDEKAANGELSIDRSWEMGLTGERIKNALLKWTVVKMDDEYFRMLGTNDEDLTTILRAFGISIPAKFFTRQDLSDIKKRIRVFD